MGAFPIVIGEQPMSERLNINVGLLGHVDSGKTSLAKALSTNASTAAFDKNPQSTERGITLDLGFSTFSLPIPDYIDHPEQFSEFQYTLVDCPGHASLIKTIIGGAHIIDMMILVIDVNKGIQTQTAECIVIGQLTTKHLIVALNKVDMIEDEKKIQRITKRIQSALAATHFKNAPMIRISANPASGNPSGIEELKETILNMITALPKIQRLKLQANPSTEADQDASFRFSIDHCFSVRGQGTVLTGTVLSGEVRVNQLIEFPDLKLQKKVKSIQMFRKPVNRAVEGDRIGICVTQLNAKLIERGVAGSPGSYLETNGAIISAEKIKFFKGTIKTKSRMHISIGHATVMATVQVFSIPPGESIPEATNFDFDREYLYRDALESVSDTIPAGSQFLLLSFEKKIICPASCMVIGSKLDTDIHANACRIAFSGTLVATIDTSSVNELQKLRVFKPRERTGFIDRTIDEYHVIGNKLFSKETNMNQFVGLTVIRTSNNAQGKIESAFGKSGKFKVYFPDGGQSGTDGDLLLKFKKFVFHKNNKIVQ